jgi:hypothetical protein
LTEVTNKVIFSLRSFVSLDTKETIPITGRRTETMATLNLKDFPEELHRQAKSRAALEGTTLRDLVIHAVAVYLKSPITLDVKEVIVKPKDSK